MPPLHVRNIYLWYIRMSLKEKGNESEEIAARHYESIGYHILERNVYFKWWELDIVAIKKGILVFIEVKIV